MQIKINRNIVLALNLIASRDESRYTLNGVCFEVTPATKTKPDRCHVIATDGRRLMAAEAGEVVIPPDKKRSAILRVNVPMIKALPKSPTGDLQISFGEKSATVRSYAKSEVSFDCELIEGNYPNWRHAVPTGEHASPIDPCFNWKLLEGFTKSAEVIAGRSDSSIRLRQNDPLAPILILFPSIPYAVGVLMPVKSAAERNSAPDWATLAGEEALSAEVQKIEPAPQTVPATAAASNPA